ncbi:MAG: PucR family transcriptional regulator [Syntrophomonadaceae bacterium]|nr:PucR family transcriptional regulator [Syntrophomonadaceae bacterium]
MSMAAPNQVYHLVDGVLDEGLAFVARYVEDRIQRPVLIADHDGRLHYPEVTGGPADIDDLFVSLPSHLRGKDFYYQPEKNCLYYRVRYNDSSAYIIACYLPAEQISQALSVMIDSKLAIKCYFSKLHKNSDCLERELAEYLFSNSNASIRDIARLSDNRLEMDRSYFVTLVEAEGLSDWTNLQVIRSYFCEYFHQHKFKVVPVSWENSLTMIIPTCVNREQLDEAFDWPSMLKFKEFLEKQFNLKLSQGTGRVYPLADVRKSFYEARVALTLPRLLGKKNFVQKFPELGLYYPIFAQDPQDIIDFCRQSLGKIIEYDEKTDGELLLTLRKLLDSSFNMKSTADSLFIHVNTLYYRVNKIEELLGIDFNNMDSRVNLFIALKVWDTLTINGLV